MVCFKYQYIHIVSPLIHRLSLSPGCFLTLVSDRARTRLDVCFFLLLGPRSWMKWISLRVHTFALISSKSALSLSMSVFCWGQPMPNPSSGFGFGI